MSSAVAVAPVPAQARSSSPLPADVPEPHATLCLLCRAAVSPALCGRVLEHLDVHGWRRLIAAAEIHGLLPLLWHLCAQNGSLPMPAEVRQGLEQQFRRYRLHRTVLEARLAQLTGALDEAGVPYAVLKGPALAATVYDPPWLRPYGDIDLLLQVPSWPRVRALLQQLGYGVGDAGTLAASQRYPGDGLNSIACTLPHAQVLLEVHFDLLQLGWASPAMGELWSRLRSAPLGEGRTISVLAPEEQVLQACVHLFYHGFYRLIWFMDLQQLLQAYGSTLDWARIVQLARREGVALPVSYALRYLLELLGVGAPAWVEAALAPRGLERWLFERVWPRPRVLRFERYEPPARLFTHAPVLRGLALHLLVLGARRQKLGRLVRYAIPPRAWMARLHGVPDRDLRLSWLYVRRVATVLRNCARLLVSEWRGGQ
jgi:hypothetical protein